MFINDVDAMGLKNGQGLVSSTTYYHDLDDGSRAFAKRFWDKMGRPPSIVQAGVYSSVVHYLKAVAATGTDDGTKVAAKMRETPVEDAFTHGAKIRADGRLLRDLYVTEVKKPEELKGPWDYWKIVATIPGEKAWRPADESECPSVEDPLRRGACRAWRTEGKLLVENDGPVTIITINRPEVRNAIDNETAAELTNALRAFDSAPDQAVAVLTGAGGHFCAGADLKELAAGREYKPWAGDPDGPCHDLLSKPVIAAVAGYACAGGLGIALRCDLRVAEESATFAVLSRRWGVPMSDGTTVRLPRLIGAGRALDMLLTARKVSGRGSGRDRACRPAGADRARPLRRGRACAGDRGLSADRDAVRQDVGDSTVGICPEKEALALETNLSVEARQKEARGGAGRFASGAGRHGAIGKD